MSTLVFNPNIGDPFNGVSFNKNPDVMNFEKINRSQIPSLEVEEVIEALIGMTDDKALKVDPEGKNTGYILKMIRNRIYTEFGSGSFVTRNENGIIYIARNRN